MKVSFFHSDKPRERLLADAFLKGAARHGHSTTAVPLGPDLDLRFDVVAIVGVKSAVRFHELRRQGVKVIMLDKGYSRGNGLGTAEKWEYWRVAVDAHQPTNNLWKTEFPTDRWDELGIELAPWRYAGNQIVLAGSSEKYHGFYGLKGPTVFAKNIVADIRRLTREHPIVYRPKPSWDGAVPIAKTAYSRLPETIHDVLAGAHALVTHGSNACFEALVHGVPSIILGDAVLKPISSTSLDDIANPILASDADRLRLAAALAYHQYTRGEFAAGVAWELIEREIHS